MKKLEDMESKGRTGGDRREEDPLPQEEWSGQRIAERDRRKRRRVVRRGGSQAQGRKGL